jgi:hypothetical protein
MKNKRSDDSDLIKTLLIVTIGFAIGFLVGLYSAY